MIPFKALGKPSDSTKKPMRDTSIRNPQQIQGGAL